MYFWPQIKKTWMIQIEGMALKLELPEYYLQKKQILLPGILWVRIHFWGHKDERNGNIYTRRGGFLDMGHLRDCADWTAPPYLLRKPDSSLSKYYELSLKLNFRFPVDSIIPERDDREITQNDFDIFVDFIQTEINKEALRKEEKEIKKEKPDKVKSKKR